MLTTELDALKAEHEIAIAELAAKHKEELAAKAGNMEELYLAHDKKISSLARDRDEATAGQEAAKRAANENAKKVAEYEEMLGTKQKALDDATAALNEIRYNLDSLKTEHTALAENVSKSVPPLLLVEEHKLTLTRLKGKNLELEAQVEKLGVGEQTPLSEID